MTHADSANPFTVQTPEDITADMVQRLWVDVFTDFAKVKEVGHAMLNGPRGCGKSMMFRHLEPDCQRLALNCDLKALRFFGILVSIKNTALNLTELERLENRNAVSYLNEHFLTMYVASRVFTALTKADVEDSKTNVSAVNTFWKEIFTPRLRRAGWSGKPPSIGHLKTVSAQFKAMGNMCDELYGEVISYVKRLALPDTRTAYTGALSDYLQFLFPILQAIRQLPFMPVGPIYLLMDDADNLNETQTRILNSWIATRTSAEVSIKVSTQLRYKTYQTPHGTMIDSPHDYSEVNIADIYTSAKGKYLMRVEAIVARRLQLHGLEASPRKFFPNDEDQEREIDAIKEKLKADFPTVGRGNTASDDVVRYARPMFIAALGGKRKSRSTYSYAGFEQLVDISSGLIRYFLEPAARMYGEEVAIHYQKTINFVSPSIQDQIVRKEAEALMFREVDKLFPENDETAASSSQSPAVRDAKFKLRNLITVLGGVFFAKLVSQDAERRVFSVALSGVPDPDLINVFELGVRFGFFQKSSIGNKDGTGRTALYILTRRLAPYFGLDPTSFAGYLFVTSRALLTAIQNPESFLRKVKKNGLTEDFEERQGKLFDAEGRAI